MTSPIDPIRRPAGARRVKPEDVDTIEHGADAGERLLPVPVETPATRAHRPEGAARGDAMFAAQLIGQDGQKRGLRGGPAMIGAAQNSYNRTEWSGVADRRRPKGRAARAKV